MSRLDAKVKRIAFLSLGGVAVATLLVAVIVALIAPKSVAAWLIGCVIVLVIVILAEGGLLLADRDPPRRPHAPNPHKGPGFGAIEDDDIVETHVIDEPTPR